jgi:hypothetical protein
VRLLGDNFHEFMPILTPDMIATIIHEMLYIHLMAGDDKEERAVATSAITKITASDTYLIL